MSDDRDQIRPRALDTLGDRLKAADEIRRRPRVPGVAAAYRLRAVAATAAILAFIALTPPGRAIAGEVAELVGIGDSATVDHQVTEAPVATRSDPTIIATGVTPDGTQYEMVTFPGGATMPDEGQTEPPDPATPGQSTCFSLDFPVSNRPFGTTTCTAGPPGGVLTKPSFNEARHGGDAVAIQLEGLTGAGVDGVEVSYGPETGGRRLVPVVFGPGSDAGYYVAYLPEAAFPGFDSPAMGSLQVTALDDHGAVLDRFDYGSAYSEVRRRGNEARCLRRLVRPYSEAEQPVPLSELRVRCRAGAG